MFAVPSNTIAVPATRAAAHPARIAAEVARDRSRWAKLLRYDPDQRFSALIEATDQVEIWLLSWLPGQHTDLHDHGGSAGAFTIVSGALTELVVKPAPAGSGVAARVPAQEPPQRPDERSGQVLHRVVAGQTRVFGPNYVHQVRNEGADPAVTIHVYRPHRWMTAYHLNPSTGLATRD